MAISDHRQRRCVICGDAIDYSTGWCEHYRGEELRTALSQFDAAEVSPQPGDLFVGDRDSRPVIWVAQPLDTDDIGELVAVELMFLTDCNPREDLPDVSRGVVLAMLASALYRHAGGELADPEQRPNPTSAAQVWAIEHAERLFPEFTGHAARERAQQLVELVLNGTSDDATDPG